MLWIKMKNKKFFDYFTILTKECLNKYPQQYLHETVTVNMSLAESTITGEVDSSSCTSIELTSPEGRMEVDVMD